LTQKDIYQLFRDYDYGWVNNWQQHVDFPISQKLANVLDKLLQLDEQNRYLTADEVLKDLENHKRGEQAVGSGPLTQRQAAFAKTSLQKQTPRFSRPKLKILLPLGVVGGLSAALLFFLRFSEQSKINVQINSQITVERSSLDPVESFAQVAQVPEGIFNYGGSTTWAPIHESVDVEIQTARPEFRLRYVEPEGVPPSSQAGLDMLVQGKVDFSLSSRLPSNELMEELKDKGINLRLVPVAENFDVAAVNRNLPVEQLTIDQLNAILEGKIRNWIQVGGPDLAITRFDRNVNQDFMDTRPNLESDNIELFLTPAEAVGTAPDFPGGIYVHSAAMLVAQCEMKTLPIVNDAGETIVPYKEPLVPVEQCSIQKNKVNLAELGSGKYPRQLSDKLYVVINENGGVEQQVGEAYANFLLSDEGQTLLEEVGYLKNR
ncbi:MAG: substrate-binding domain-containing protein, partial [Cyanobacteria bacterium P01_C01_bin.118]